MFWFFLQFLQLKEGTKPQTTYTHQTAVALIQGD